MNKKIFLIFLFCANIFAWSVVYDLNQIQAFQVVFFDIGQGDSIFVQTPYGYQVLIDGGPTDIVLEKLGGVMNFWDKSIDVVVLTHPDHDHIAGLIEVLKKYKVDFVLWNGLLKETGESSEWERLLQEKPIETRIVFSGYKIITPMVTFDILHPFESLENMKVKNINNSSVVLRVVFEDTSFLLTGDIGSSIEKEILKKENLISSDVLKIAHHGSKTSSLEEFVKIVNPAVAVISVGKNNPYNHPHPTVLELLNKYDINILRTDLVGDIRIISDGKNIKIN